MLSEMNFIFFREVFFRGADEPASLISDFKTEMMDRNLWDVVVNDFLNVHTKRDFFKAIFLRFCFDKHVKQAGDSGSIDSQVYGASSSCGPSKYLFFDKREARILFLFRTGGWRFCSEFLRSNECSEICSCGDDLSTFHIFTSCPIFALKRKLLLSTWRVGIDYSLMDAFDDDLKVRDLLRFCELVMTHFNMV